MKTTRSHVLHTGFLGKGSGRPMRSYGSSGGGGYGGGGGGGGGGGYRGKSLSSKTQFNSPKSKRNKENRIHLHTKKH